MMKTQFGEKAVFLKKPMNGIATCEKGLRFKNGQNLQTEGIEKKPGHKPMLKKDLKQEYYRISRDIREKEMARAKLSIYPNNELILNGFLSDKTISMLPTIEKMKNSLAYELKLLNTERNEVVNELKNLGMWETVNRSILNFIINDADLKACEIAQMGHFRLR